jgi:hypothetical protein
MIFVEADVRSSNMGLFSYEPEAGVPAAVIPDLYDGLESLSDMKVDDTLTIRRHKSCNTCQLLPAG